MPLFLNVPSEVLALILHSVDWEDLRQLQLTSTDAKDAVYGAMKSRASTFMAMCNNLCFNNMDAIAATPRQIFRDSPEGEHFHHVYSIWFTPSARTCTNRKWMAAYLAKKSYYTSATVMNFECIDACHEVFPRPL